MQLNQLSSQIQVKFNQFSRHYVVGFNRPLQKLLRQMLFGILKSGKVQLNTIGRALPEKIPLKWTTKRLGQHLGIGGLWLAIMNKALHTQRSYLRQCCYMVIDLSDIQKRYAEQMAGLADVYDGGEHATGPGYWLCNMTSVDESGALMVPAYSELYSLAEESSSENAKL